jgi:predicted MFS family arabinose efflux permease
MAVVNYAAQSAPTGMRATGQAIVGAAQGGLGWAMGSVIGGVLWQGFGGAVVLWAAAALMLAAALVYSQANPLSRSTR